MPCALGGGRVDVRAGIITIVRVIVGAHGCSHDEFGARARARVRVRARARARISVRVRVTMKVRVKVRVRVRVRVGA